MPEPREVLLRTFLRGEKVLGLGGLPWDRSAANIKAARMELAQLGGAEPSEPSVKPTPTACPWCGGARWYGPNPKCTKCGTHGGIQAKPIAKTTPDVITFFFARQSR